MKLIADIRFFESETVDTTNPPYIGEMYKIDYKVLAAVAERFILRLREKRISLPDFDHIYVCVSPSLNNGTVEFSNREVDRYSPFYRFVNAGLCDTDFNLLSESKKIQTLISIAVQSVSLYLNEESICEDVTASADYILANGSESILVFKEKQGKNYSVQIMVQVLSFNAFLPFVRVLDANNHILKEFKPCNVMTLDEFSMQYGSINITAKMVTIKPKKNAFSSMYNFASLTFPI